MPAGRAPYFSWTDAAKSRLEELWRRGLTAQQCADEMGLPGRNSAIGMIQRLGLNNIERPARPKREKLNADRRDPTGLSRFAARTHAAPRKRALQPDNAAVVEGRTIFPSRRRRAVDVERVLKCGSNSSKIGKRITKGRWRGFPIVTLTLEERATCPRTCQEWRTCYGANMQYAQRIRHDSMLEPAIWGELVTLQAQHPGGFAVRLHVLGDFYSLDYVDMWAAALDEFPALHVFGFTARRPGTEIGDALLALSRLTWDRFAIRFSGCGLSEMGSEVVDHADQARSLICPVQTGKTAKCGTCGFCWQSRANITFLRH